MTHSAAVHSIRKRQRNVVMRLSPISIACASVLIASGSVYAQDAQATDGSLSTVTVTGIRRGIESAIAAKKNNDSIVESVNAEDIGKLPDSSIADSIARLPGVAAQRVDGRPSAISIRGLGPDFTGALLNGREVVSSGDGRAADYDQFPSELVSQVLIYKTPDASLMGQGLSGTIDVRPVMPLNSRGRQVAVSVRGENNSNGGLVAGGASADGNRLSLSYVDQFNDNTVGLALGFAHLDSKEQSKQYESWKYGDYVGSWGAGATGLPAGSVASQGFSAGVVSGNQVRDGFMGVLEVKPNKDFHSVIDLYYSKFKHDTKTAQWAGDLGLWSGPASAYSNVGTTPLNGNTVVSSGTVANGHSVIDQKANSRTDELFSVGMKNELKLDSKWTGLVDLGISSGKRNESLIESIGVGPSTGALFNFSGLATNNNFAWSTNQDLTAQGGNVTLSNNPDWAQLVTPSYTDDMKSLRLSAKRDLESAIFSTFESGINFNQRDKTSNNAEYKLALGAANVAIPASALRGNTNLSMGGINTPIATWDPNSLMGLYTATPKNPWNAQSQKYSVHEKITTAFAKSGIDTDVAGIPVRGNIGVQAIHTDQSSDGYNWNNVTNTATPISQGTNYDDLLPSMNLAFSLKPDLIVRLGVAQEMARPRMDDLRAGIDAPKLVANGASAPAGTGKWQANGGGKPDLQPWRADALDLSLEKYFGKSSYVAAAAFYKNMRSFIYKQDTVRDFTGATDSAATGLTPWCASPGCNPNLGTITTAANGQGGKVWGAELSASLEGGLVADWLKGFGIVASESFTWNSLPLDNNGNPINLDGFSGVVNNLTFYYEQGGLSTRISQRYRSAFTASTTGILLRNETASHIDAETQVDFQIGYEFKEGPYKGLSTLLQVNNLTNQPAVQTQGPEVGGNGTGLLPWKYQTYGTQYLLGLNYKF